MNPQECPHGRQVPDYQMEQYLNYGVFVCDSANKPVKNGRHVAPEKKKQITHMNGLVV